MLSIAMQNTTLVLSLFKLLLCYHSVLYFGMIAHQLVFALEAFSATSIRTCIDVRVPHILELVRLRSRRGFRRCEDTTYICIQERMRTIPFETLYMIYIV